MGRFPQPSGGRGSLRQIQHLVNDHPGVLNQAIGIGPITWHSPLAADDLAEYRDQSFLNRLGVLLPLKSLADFWPTRGPQWDALGRADSGEVVLVEAKAHVREILSSASQASPVSLARIQKSLAGTALALDARPGADWALRFYQYANRLAHAHLLQTLNGIATRLVFVYFIGDRDMNGPQSRREWESSILILQEGLGIRGRLPKYVIDAFIDVGGPSPVAA